MASYQDGPPFEFCLGHKREQSQDSGAYIDWNSEDSASPVSNPDSTVNEDFITVVSVENGESKGKKDISSSFVTILAIGNSENEVSKEADNGKEEEVLLYRLPGERLGFGLKFEGGTNTAENVKKLFIQSSAPDSPASRAKCSWGSLVEGDEILKIDGHVVKDMTRLDCVRCLKESSVVIKLYVRHKGQKSCQSRKQENTTEIRVNNASSSSPMVVSAEMKKTIPPPPPVPPRKIAKKSPVLTSKEESSVVSPPEGFCDQQNVFSPVPKVRNIQVVADETSKNLSKFVIRVPQKGGHDSPDLAKRLVKKTGSDLKLIPPEPKVYLDLLAQEDGRNCESESDDTGSTISTVVGFSIPNTTNSSFSDLRSPASSFCDSTNPSTPTSEPTTPVLDLSKIFTPYEHTDNNEYLFTKLINGKDQDSISYEEKISNGTDDIAPLQPPLSFQDAPLSYGNEEMRANLTENIEFHDDAFTNTKAHQNEIICEFDSPLEGKNKENNSKSIILSKKPSLIPRLAKSIGLLSPPKPSPRKEPMSDGSKSRFNKKKAPLPPSVDAIQSSQSESIESKTLKSSIPYLKKKKVKNDESKKNSKTDKKSKPSNAMDDINRKKSILLPNEPVNQNPEIGDTKKQSETLKSSENDRKLTWEVPDLKSSKGVNNLESGNKIKNDLERGDFCDVSAIESKDFLLNLENSEFTTDVGGISEPHFLFPWGGSKQLETIGEDEEDLSMEDVSDRCASGDKKKEDKSPIKIVEEMAGTGSLKDEKTAGEIFVIFNNEEETLNEELKPDMREVEKEEKSDNDDKPEERNSDEADKGVDEPDKSERIFMIENLEEKMGESKISPKREIKGRKRP